MPIINALSSAVSQLTKAPLVTSSQAIKAQNQSADSTEGTERSEVGRKANSGSGLSLELDLASGQRISLDIRINQAGGLSELTLATRSDLSADDEQRLKDFLTQLSTAVDELFSRNSNSRSLFQFANQKGIKDVEMSAYHDNGNVKQALEFDKQEANKGSGRKIDALWYEYDRAKGVEESHDFNLAKQPKRNDQTAIYGSMNYQWLLDQVGSAMEVIEDKQQGKKITSFFLSGVQALFSSANAGSALLQELGASAEQAQDFVGHSIKVLAGGARQEKQMNALADFNMSFSSQRQSKQLQSTADVHSYQLNMMVSQNSDQGNIEQKDQSYQVQNRRLRMNYQSNYQQAVYEYTWTRDESIRNVYDKGRLASSHYRLQENIQSQLLHDVNSLEMSENKEREDRTY